MHDFAPIITAPVEILIKPSPLTEEVPQEPPHTPLPLGSGFQYNLPMTPAELVLDRINRPKARTSSHKTINSKPSSAQRPLTVVELFAGVGGFRIGLEGGPRFSKSKSAFKVIWSNQWEPASQTQHAADVYLTRWGTDAHLDFRDVNEVVESDIDAIPDCDVLVGGFPCQDYSVAKPLPLAKGIVGSKGVLWWSIYNILNNKARKPGYLILENVDRLLKSPSGQRGRDFAIILTTLAKLGYAVEWRVINAADYGFPQRRKRVFILAYHKDTALYSDMCRFVDWPKNWLLESGVLAKAFPGKIVEDLGFPVSGVLDPDPVTITKHFGKDTGGMFCGAGMMIGRRFWMADVKADYRGERKLLGSVLQEVVPSEYYVDQKALAQWKYLKGAKNEARQSKSGFEYKYSEGSMAFPDSLDRPARTIITGEGGPSPSRFKHIIKDAIGYRRLTPLELERLNGFPDDHTKADGISEVKRAFFMGNALVVGVVERLGHQLARSIKNAQKLR